MEAIAGQKLGPAGHRGEYFGPPQHQAAAAKPWPLICPSIQKTHRGIGPHASGQKGGG